jgi:hypothetical protein
MRGDSTDFVISKVGLSVCALISASVLGAVFSDSGVDDRRQELRVILQRMCDLISSAAVAGGDSVRMFCIPSLSTGEPIRTTVTVDGAIMSSGTASEIDHPCTRIHLWHWDGRELNDSVITALDRSYGETTAHTGETLEIFAMSVMVDGIHQVLVFVLKTGPC